MSILIRKNKLFNLEPALKKTEQKIKEHVFPLSTFSKTDGNSSLDVGTGVIITGSIVAKDEVKIQGRVEADVEAKKIIVGKNGEVQGKIKTNVLEVEGKANGEIEVENLIKILSSGTINGKVSYRKLEVQEGGLIKGELSTKEMKQEEFKNQKVIWWWSA